MKGVRARRGNALIPTIIPRQQTNGHARTCYKTTYPWKSFYTECLGEKERKSKITLLKQGFQSPSGQ